MRVQVANQVSAQCVPQATTPSQVWMYAPYAQPDTFVRRDRVPHWRVPQAAIVATGKRPALSRTLDITSERPINQRSISATLATIALVARVAVHCAMRVIDAHRGRLRKLRSTPSALWAASATLPPSSPHVHPASMAHWKRV